MIRCAEQTAHSRIHYVGLFLNKKLIMITCAEQLPIAGSDHRHDCETASIAHR